MHQALFVGVNLFDHGIHDRLDLFVFGDAFLDDFRRAELVATMDQVDLRRITCQEVGFFTRGIATAHDRDDLAAEKRAIAYRAVRHALPRIFDFTRNAQLDGCSIGGDDDGGRAFGLHAVADAFETVVHLPDQCASSPSQRIAYISRLA